MRKIVIVGGGVGGLVLATRLGKKLGRKGLAHITLIDKNAHHFWKPMLHEVAAGTRNAYIGGVDFRTQGRLNHFRFRQGELLTIDRAQQKVTISSLKNNADEVIFPQSQYDYDVLILAMGSVANDFGTPGVKEHCMFLNDYVQAEEFREQLLETLYRFSAQIDDNENHKINISIVGGGATGVELAAELLKTAERLRDYDVAYIKPDRLDIKILEAANRILPAVPERLAHSIKGKLEQMGIVVLTNAMITKADDKGFYTKGGDFIASDLMVWTAGVKAHDILRNMGGLESARGNQFVVKSTLQTTLDERIFAIGDCAACLDDEGNQIAPATAQAAAQMSLVCSKNVLAFLNGKAMKKFAYKDKGTIISIAHTAQGVVSTLAGVQPVIVKGTPAYTMHKLFYHAHQAELYGYMGSVRLAMAGRWIDEVKSSLDLPLSATDKFS